MDGVKALLEVHWLTHTRAQKGPRSRTNDILSFGIGAILVVGVWVLGRSITRALRSGDAHRGLLALEALLLAVFFLWLAAPILASNPVGKGTGIPLSRMALFPVRASHLYLTLSLAPFLRPVYWILAIISLLAVVPVGALASPVTALIAAICYLLSCVMFSWALMHFEAAVLASRRAREMGTVILGVLGLSGYVLIHAEVERDASGYWIEVFRQRALLIDNAGNHGLLGWLQGVTPAGWVVQSGSGSSESRLYFVGLIALVCVCAALGTWSLRRRLSHPPTGGTGSRRRIRSLLGLRGLPMPMGVLAEKELRYLMRTLDAIIGWTLGLGGATVLLLYEGSRPWWAWSAVAIIIFGASQIPLNAFGLDGRPSERYRLFPVSGGDVVLSKNIAYFCLLATAISPILLATAIRHGVGGALAAGLAAASLTLMMVLHGNSLSIEAPVPREFYTAGSEKHGGGISSVIFLLLMLVLPFGLLAALRGHMVVSLSAQIVLLVIVVSAYRRSLPGVGEQFTNAAETMRARMAG